ncbi:MAG: GNAT family N-acetyltransferase [Christensenellales bacterium]
MPQTIPGVKHLIVTENAQVNIVAFMGLEDTRVKMLFPAPFQRGQGLCKQLLQYVLHHYRINRVTVNEQNPQAVGFYRHLGFETYKRTDCDEQGNPYPILYMKLTR